MERDTLVKFFSEFWSVPAAEVSDVLRLDETAVASHSSFRFYQFIAALESNYGVRVTNLAKIKTFGDLWRDVR